MHDGATTKGGGETTKGTVRRHPLLAEHWVFWLLLGGIALATLASVIVDVPRPVPGWALEQPLVYRVEFGGVLLLALYALLIALRLGWHNETLSKIQVGLVGGEAPAEEAAAAELTKLKADIEDLTKKTSGALVKLDARVSELEATRRFSPKARMRKPFGR